jgi:hypothetical protein
VPESPTILELISNGTMSAEMAATLWAAVDQRWSFVVTAVPRLAGKTTNMNAMLALLPQNVLVHRLSGDMEEMARLQRAATGGYLVVGEFSQAPVPTYIWGAPVRRVFEALDAGYSLATALHAPNLLDTFNVVCNENGVTDAQASRIRLVLYIRRFGASPNTYWRRMAQVHEIERVEGGQPVGRLLHRWVEGEDRFEAVERPRLLPNSPGDLTERSARMKALAQAGRTSPEDVTRLVVDFHGHR